MYLSLRRYSLFVCSLLAATSMSAQGTRDRVPTLDGRARVISEIERAQVRVGPFRLLSEFRIGEANYEQDLLVPRTSSENDLVLSISAPQKLYFVPAKKFAVSAEVEPIYLWFIKANERSDFGSRYRGDVHFLFNRLYLDVWGAIEDRQTRENSEFTDLAQQKTLDFGFVNEVLISSRSGLHFSGTHRDLEYPAGQFQTGLGELGSLNRKETRFTGAFQHKTFPSTSLVLGADSDLYDFDLNERDGNRTTVFVGATRHKAINDFEAKFGYSRLTYDSAAHQDFGGLIGSLKWTASPRRNWRMNAGASRNIQFSVFQNDLHFVENRVGAGTAYDFGRRLTVDGAVQVGTNDYVVPTIQVDGSSSQVRSDDLRYATLGFLVHVTSHFGAGLAAGAFERDSNFDQFDEDGIQLFLRLSITP